MKLTEALKKSEIVAIEGEPKSGKLTFAIYVNTHYLDDNSPLLIFSTLPKKLMTKRLNIISNFVDQQTREKLNNTTLLCLKENFKNLKQFYDFHLIIKDIEKAIDEIDSHNIIFHRLDQMFEVQDGNDAEWFVESLLNLKEEKKLKLFITLDPTVESYDFLQSYMKNYIDIDLAIQKAECREIEIISSIFPIDAINYKFYKNKTNNNLEIGYSSINSEIENTVLELPDTISSKKSKKRLSHKTKILIQTTNISLISMHEYIFNRDDFEVYISSSLLDTINYMEIAIDLLIYNYDKFDETKEMYKVLQRYGYRGHMICISTKPYIRSTDRMIGVNYGCEDMFPINFLLEEYILSIERTLQYRFYSTKIHKIPSNKEVANNITEFCKTVNILIEEHIYFTVLVVESDVSENTLKKRFRDKDIFCYLDNILLILLLNSRKEIVEDRIVPNLNFENEKKFIIKNIIEANILQSKKDEFCKEWKSIS